jgi:hypothetical protein
VVRESDRQKFVQLAQARVNRTLKDIQLIGNLSNRSNYDYTDDDIERIFKALAQEIAACRKRFELSKRKADAQLFTLE